jgi:hypothetical protein
MFPRLGQLKNHPLNPRQASRSGLGLIVVGLLLIGFIAAIAAFFLDLISLSIVFPGVYRDPEAGPMSVPITAWLFILFFALFGVVSVAEGIWRIWFGQRNKYLTKAMIVMGLIFVAAGIIAQGLS